MFWMVLVVISCQNGWSLTNFHASGLSPAGAALASGAFASGAFASGALPSAFLAGAGGSFFSWATMVVIRPNARPQAASRRKRITTNTLRGGWSIYRASVGRIQTL